MRLIPSDNAVWWGARPRGASDEGTAAGLALLVPEGERAGLLALNRVSLTAISRKAPIGLGQGKPANASTA